MKVSPKSKGHPVAKKTKASGVMKSNARPEKTTPEQSAFVAEYKARKWAEYDKRNKELREQSPSIHERFHAAMKDVHAFHADALWFAENTPHPFRESYFPQNLLFASVAARYTCELARLGNEDSIREVALLAVSLCECMDELLAGEGAESERAAEIMRHQARELPYWPMLQCLHAAGNNHFPRVAERLKLGVESWANVSEKAGYSLQTPMNRYVWRVLRLFQEAQRYILKEIEDKKKGRVGLGLDQYRMMTDKEKEIARASIEIGKPTKANSKEWTDKAVMPFIEAREADFERVPEFSQAVKRAKSPKRYLQRKEIRRDVLHSLESIAPAK